MFGKIGLCLALGAAMVVACSQGEASAGGKRMRITSEAFSEREMIPSRYTCDVKDLIPPLNFENVPQHAAALALVVDDPDAPNGTWDHWVVWNISPTTPGVREGHAPEGVVGHNSWGKSAWGGPCPPNGQHRYVFTLYALDAKVQLPATATKKDLERAIAGHVVEQARLTGVYDRGRR
jgi:hypothetical protein